MNLQLSTLTTLLLLVLTTLPTTQTQASDPQQPRPTQPTEYTSTPSFTAAILRTTNTYRAQHNATSLTWNASLANSAQDWSSRCAFQHSGRAPGENLAAGYANASAAVEAWGHERVEYDFGRPGFAHETGHFTQLVWKATRTTGCGRSFCGGRRGTSGWFVVCEYWPHGNVVGDFAENVQAQVKDGRKGGSGGYPYPQGGGNGGGGKNDGKKGDEKEEPCMLGAVCKNAAGSLTRERGSRLLATVIWLAYVVVMGSSTGG